jgi:predicted nucleotidyltransferase
MDLEMPKAEASAGEEVRLQRNGRDFSEEEPGHNCPSVHTLMRSRTKNSVGKKHRMQIMTTQKEILETLSLLDRELVKDYKVQRIGLFGSYARSEQRPESDIDLLVAFADGADLFDLARLKYFLEEHLGHRVDIVPERALRNELKKSVLADVKYA